MLSRNISIAISMAGIIALAFIAMSCRNSVSTVSSVQARHVEKTDTDVTVPVSMPLDPTSPVFKQLINVDAVVHFYKSRNGKPVWLVNNLPRSLADSMCMFIQQALYFGLHPNDYHDEELEYQKKNLAEIYNQMRLEALLTDSFFSFVKDLRYGKHFPKPASDSVGFSLINKLTQGSGLNEILASCEPSQKAYYSLKKVLHVALDTLSADDRELLRISDTTFSPSLNEKLKAIEVNLERWRKEKDLGSRYVLVNIPSFMLYVIDNDSVIMESKVIVGKPESPTPVFSSLIECFVVYPYWHVPRKIAVEEYLPALKRDTSFLSKNNFDVLDRKGRLLNPDSVNWSRFSKDHFPVTLRQRDGSENSLGVVKFVFDNPYAVFIHDTNAKRLFRNQVRAYSHGCIRMERALDLAHFLATGQMGEKSPEVGKYLKEHIRHTVNAKEPIPVHIRYYTADVKADQLFVYRDLYNLDKRTETYLHQ